jgi:hypothetical protein
LDAIVVAVAGVFNYNNVSKVIDKIRKKNTKGSRRACASRALPAAAAAVAAAVLELWWW